MEKNKTAMLTGQKFYKEDEDGSIRVIRITEDKGDSVLYRDDYILFDPSSEKDNYDTVEIKKSELEKEYLLIEPDGLISVIEDNLYETKDVVVLFQNFVVATRPVVICRQCARDLFFSDDNNDVVGMCFTPIAGEMDVNTIMDTLEFLSPKNPSRATSIYYYLNDEVEDILKYIDINPFDNIMLENYEEYSKEVPEAQFTDYHGGWCKNVKLLLSNNGFQKYVDYTFGILNVDFDMKEYLEIRELPEKFTDMHTQYYACNEELREWLTISGVVKDQVVEDSTVLEYYQDLDPEEIRKVDGAVHVIMRDSNQVVWWMTLYLDGKKNLQDLLDNYDKTHIGDKLRFAAINKRI